MISYVEGWDIMAVHCKLVYFTFCTLFRTIVYFELENNAML